MSRSSSKSRGRHCLRAHTAQRRARCAEPGTLLHWLTERYCMYASDKKGNIHIVDIHHLPWPLQQAKV
ncbi:MAG TPA: DUF2071 domain-containing protein [Paenibacillus sp.]|uniref:DUF2071 domain-containing protein n=1 Tax=Paenibacillus sp. TaxID=58172 RepID=UPI002C472BC8|nr:DUF2071 domain-containing protein [Paenibacillus sp.]HUC93031.1 DUF2071 domain-containing protein [Paenibacillus sp.]